jgi:predicted methyltransferase
MKIVAVLMIVVALVSGAVASDNASNSAAAPMAVADPSRPDSDTTRDADRKPAQTLVFVGAAPGAPANVTETLHRIESSTVRREVEAAGFKFDSESSILANPADPRTAKVFDQTIRGHTDQFILKFRKPK